MNDQHINQIVDANGDLPRKYHNAPVVIGGFSEPMAVRLPIGGTISPAQGTQTEFYTIANMGDPSTKPSLTITIANDFTDMLLVGGSGTPVPSFVIEYGKSATFLKVNNGGSCVFIIDNGALEPEQSVSNTATPMALVDKWDYVATDATAEQSMVEAFPGCLNHITGNAEVNMPINCTSGEFMVIKAAPGSTLSINFSAGETMDGQANPTIQSGDSVYIVFDGTKTWIRI